MTQIYSYQFQVQPSDIDQFHHVNNLTYVHWIIEASARHSLELGYSLERFIKEGAGFVVKSHQIHYHKPALLSDKLRMNTWLTKVNPFRVERVCELNHLNDESLIMSSSTCWVYVDLQTGSPIAIRPELFKILEGLARS